jgi:cellobiose phosphorylase
MDHGAWPLLTTTLYIHQTGDLAFLLRDQTYFKDHLIFRSQEIDPDWEPDQGTLLLTVDQEPYRGTILEHMLIQHLTPFYNVGAHNNIFLEGADWNDGMDMAPDRGESVAFTALYAGNLHQLSEWVLALSDLGVDRVELAAEIIPLLDTLASPVDYASVDGKRSLLEAYYKSVLHAVTGDKIAVPLEKITSDLQAKSDWLVTHIRKNEWIQNKDGYRWFNGYYDNNGQRVEGDHPGGVRMTLTGQVFTLMSGIATDEQARDIVRTADRYLLDPSVGGYRLNTDFGEVMLNLGRAFGFAYGHKENGAMFSHMAVMYANALYKRSLVEEGHKVLEDIYRHCQNFTISRMYPGIPEYINPDGRGMYTWLTGSASWYLLTMVTEVFGVRGINGDLKLDPKLVATQFDDAGESSITTLFANKLVEVIYQNPDRLDYGQYQVVSTTIDGEPAIFSTQDGTSIIPRATIIDNSAKIVKITVGLGSRT